MRSEDLGSASWFLKARGVSSLGFDSVRGEFLSFLSLSLLFLPILKFERGNEPLLFKGAKSIALLGFVYSGDGLLRADV